MLQIFDCTVQANIPTLSLSLCLSLTLHLVVVLLVQFANVLNEQLVPTQSGPGNGKEFLELESVTVRVCLSILIKRTTLDIIHVVELHNDSSLTILQYLTN